ncbi:NAD(P)/FAD-dependent oxidoreductase [Ectothiorhodospiraceae bacterium WFHF3C12]|nr:NAD(P)/FAD-dependent oxidoreductase [Ectothiorhodospiraceae bacterium WFHF3C12]
MTTESSDSQHRVLVVGGGAGGLELATRLARGPGRRGRLGVTLVDANLTHVWKPLFHEVAAGTLDSQADALPYLAQASRYGFRFHYGRMCGLDRGRKRIRLASVAGDDGAELVPERELAYDTLVLAVGSVSNNFGTPGAAEHCMYLDSIREAQRFQQSMVRAFLRAQAQQGPLSDSQLSVAIVGGGATGVELAAELRNAARRAVSYGLDRIDPERDLKLTLIEAADRVLPALSERLSEKTERELTNLGVRVVTAKKVVEVTREGVALDGGEFVPAEFRVWSAGIKAPDWLAELDGLETNRANQLVVNASLQTSRDGNVFALGDCAACPRESGLLVPPRAQAASQQAGFLAEALDRRARGVGLGEFAYEDYGSLISLSDDNAVGRLMGNLFGSLMIEGFMARMAYAMLYKKHLMALHGFSRVVTTTLLQALTRHTRPRLKLH